MKKYSYLALLLLVLLSACDKQNQLYNTAPISDYFPLETGKYITYNLDSTVYINFGQKDTVIKYLIKDSIETQITDNLGRPAYRIVRYIRKNTAQAWTPSNTFMAVSASGTLEYVEDNLRFQKLKLPIKNGYTWKGNSYFDTYSLNSNYKFFDDWNYTYDSVGSPLTLGTFHFDNSLKVNQRDETLGQDPKLSTTQFAEKNYSIEKYAKNIGLVYKEFLHWDFQGSQSSSPGYTGYGVKLTMTGHN